MVADAVLKAWVTAKSLVVVGESGASLVEYALLVALIALAAIAAIGIVGDNVSQEFTDIGNCVADPAACP